MRTVYIKRDPSTVSGTHGTLTAGMLQLYTAEPPWKNNLPHVSCILPPPGFTRKYRVVPHESPKFGKCFLITETEGRDNILFHRGNFSGDLDAKLKSDTEGCVMVGNAIGPLAGQEALLGSGDAWRRFTEEMGWEPFDLVISWA